MLTIKVPMVEGVDENTHEFVILNEFSLDLEHSLISLSKWESKFEKPFLSTEAKTGEEIFEYVRFMTLTPNVPSEVFERISEENVRQIDEYMNAKMTATWFSDDPGKSRTQEIITNELIYYWMFSYGINKECERWHLARLFTLIKVFSEKNKPRKKMGPSEIARRQRSLNEQRRALSGSSG